MIKHLVFDIHGVLLAFDPEPMVMRKLINNLYVKELQQQYGIDDHRLCAMVKKGKAQSKEILGRFCTLCDFRPCKYSFKGAATDHGLPLPHIQDFWERGFLSNEEAMKTADESFDRYQLEEYPSEIEMIIIHTYAQHHLSVPHFLTAVSEIPGAAQLVRAVVESNAPTSLTYTLLSNGRHEWYDHYLRLYPHLFYPFTYHLFSSQIHLLKPDTKIFGLEPFSAFLPEETLFIDDRPENVEAARKEGMKGIVFDHRNMSLMRKKLYEYGVMQEKYV